jgi:diguanylate cyclase (GGDEF)-like protein
MIAWVLVMGLAAYGIFAWWRGRSLLAELRATREHLTRALQHDELTSLLNPAGFELQLDQRVKNAQLFGGEFCVLYVGLDNFGQINDGLGKELGDRLLVEVSARIMDVYGIESQGCRVAGSEYALIVSGPLDVGRNVSAVVLQRLGEPYELDTINIRLTCSIGVAAYPDHGAREKVMGNAAMAMRAVKLNGGSDFCLYEPQMGVKVREQVQLLGDLRKAMQLGQFQLYFQPKIDAHSLQVTAAEALLRWHHPQKGFISPAVFIPLAEKHGLIGDIGRWVIKEACRNAARWREKGLRMRVAVNISGYQMREEDLVDRIEATLRRNQLQPERFTCEITESVAMEDTRVTQQSFDKMRKAGLHVSIDDFGTGFSNPPNLSRYNT